MKKTDSNFDLWNKEKKFLEFFKKKIKLVKIWEIWIAKVWINLWSEISKDWDYSRPILVISNFLWWDLVWIIPFTTKYNDKYKKYLLEFEDFEKFWLKEKSYLVLNQFKTISIKRLERKLNNKNTWWKYIKFVSSEIIDKIKNELIEKIL